ncbi:MAG TPA: hypothetical protein VF656_09815 [Pyrinomonadaceae bacterium]|jgi:biopolymer transport protein ExbD
MNIPRLPVASFMLSLALGFGCAEVRPQQRRTETKPKPSKDSPSAETPPPNPAQLEPHSLALVVVIGLEGQVTVNLEAAGTTEHTEPLVERLKRIFAERERNQVYEPGGEAEKKIAKSVFVRTPSSARYGAVVRVIDAIKAAGGDPVGLQVDEPKRNRRRKAVRRRAGIV